MKHVFNTTDHTIVLLCQEIAVTTVILFIWNDVVTFHSFIETYVIVSVTIGHACYSGQRTMSQWQSQGCTICEQSNPMYQCDSNILLLWLTIFTLICGTLDRKKVLGVKSN